MSLKIYCTGPIGPNDWRTTLVEPALLQISAEEIAAMLATDDDFYWPRRPKAIFGRFDYVGPYFIDPALSEAADDYMLCYAIDDADVVFAYLTEEGQNTRFGIELGYAAGIQKPIWISNPRTLEGGNRDKLDGSDPLRGWERYRFNSRFPLPYREQASQQERGEEGRIFHWRSPGLSPARFLIPQGLPLVGQPQPTRPEVKKRRKQ